MWKIIIMEGASYLVKQHIVSSLSACEDVIPFEGSASQLTKLNYINDAHFPLPVQRNQHKVVAVNVADKLFIPARAKGIFQIAPHPSWHIMEARQNFDFDKPRQEIESSEGTQFVKEVALVKEEMRLIKPGQDKITIPGADVEVVTLGTGSAVPSKYRNGISTLQECILIIVY